MAENIDLSTASAEELATLPGIGATLAERIVAYRETSGPFRAIADLLGVRGVTERIIDSIAGRVRVGNGDSGKGGDGGDDGERYEPGDQWGGDPVRIHEAYVQHHLEGEVEASPEAYTRARDQFRRLPGVVQRPTGDLNLPAPREEPEPPDPPLDDVNGFGQAGSENEEDEESS